MHIKYPEYDKSLLSLTSSVLKHYGAESSHASYPYIDDLLARDYMNVVVMLFDGLGTRILEKHYSLKPKQRRQSMVHAASRDILTEFFEHGYR